MWHGDDLPDQPPFHISKGYYISTMAMELLFMLLLLLFTIVIFIVIVANTDGLKLSTATVDQSFSKSVFLCMHI